MVFLEQVVQIAAVFGIFELSRRVVERDDTWGEALIEPLALLRDNGFRHSAAELNDHAALLGNRYEFARSADA